MTNTIKYVLLAVIIQALVSIVLTLQVGDRVCLKSGVSLKAGALSTGAESGVVVAVKRNPSGSTWVKMNLDANVRPDLLQKIAVVRSGEDGILLADGAQEAYGVIRKKIENDHTGIWASLNSGLIYDCSLTVGNSSKNWPVPYIHQVFDTPNSFCGQWACGPTSSVMSVAYYQKIAPHPITVSIPTAHTSLYGWYVAELYKSNITHSAFDRMQTDACSKPAHGAYGTCTEGGGAWAWRIQDYVKRNGLQNKFYDTATFNIIKTAIDNHRLVVLSTKLTSAGHLVLVRGYDTSNGKMDLFVNDPWGDKTKPEYGKHKNGENVRYSWTVAAAKWMVEVWN